MFAYERITFIKYVILQNIIKIYQWVWKWLSWSTQGFPFKFQLWEIAKNWCKKTNPCLYATHSLYLICIPSKYQKNNSKYILGLHKLFVYGQTCQQSNRWMPCWSLYTNCFQSGGWKCPRPILIAVYWGLNIGFIDMWLVHHIKWTGRVVSNYLTNCL